MLFFQGCTDIFYLLEGLLGKVCVLFLDLYNENFHWFSGEIESWVLGDFGQKKGMSGVNGDTPMENQTINTLQHVSVEGNTKRDA